MPKKKSKSILSDAEVAAKAREYKKYQKRAAKYNQMKSDIGKELVAEFEARGTHLLENDGVRVTDTIQMRTLYDFEAIVDLYGPKVARKVQKREVDPTLLSQAIQAGVIAQADLPQFTNEVEHARYPTISFTEK